MKKPSNKNRIKILLQLDLCENCLSTEKYERMCSWVKKSRNLKKYN